MQRCIHFTAVQHYYHHIDRCVFYLGEIQIAVHPLLGAAMLCSYTDFISCGGTAVAHRIVVLTGSVPPFGVHETFDPNNRTAPHQ